MTADTYAELPVRRGINFADPQQSAENLLAFQDAVQAALRTEEAQDVLPAIQRLRTAGLESLQATVLRCLTARVHNAQCGEFTDALDWVLQRIDEEMSR